MTHVYVWAEIEKAFVQKAARYCARRYRHYGVEADDVAQEMLAWLYGKGEKKVVNWLSKTPQQTTRIYRSLLDEGLTYGEAEKAERVGYHPDDTLWYTPKMIEAVMPLVLDTTYDGLSGLAEENSGTGGKAKKPSAEGNDLMTTVVDVRRALKKCPAWVALVFLQSVPDGAGWEDAVQALINVLGGEGPSVGRRRAISNAHAGVITQQGEQG
jgi:hypothetical protein